MSIYKRADGKWSVQVDGHAGAKGERRRRTLGSFETKTEAKRAERDALTARDKGFDLAPKGITFNDLFERFMAARVHEHSATTIYGYRAAWNRCEPIATLRVDRIRPAHLANLYARLTASGRHDGGPLSPKSVGHTAALIRTILHWAVDLELVARNVAAVEAARPPRCPQTRATAYDVDDAVRLASKAKATRYGPLVIVAFATALRRGELAGLRWQDVDLDRAIATISGAVVQVPGKPPRLKTTKTGTIASIALSPAAVDALRKQGALQAQEKLLAGAFYEDLGFVFASPGGGIPSPGAISHAIARIAKRAGTPLRGVHAMRHSAATWMIRAGADIRTVQAVLRHSSATTTMNIYSHEVKGAQAEAVAHIDRNLSELPRTDGSQMAAEAPASIKTGHN